MKTHISKYMKHTDYSCKIMSVGAKIGEPKNQVDFIVSGYFHTVPEF
jgi:hypothetical protein